jgi:hypothetical protein
MSASAASASALADDAEVPDSGLRLRCEKWWTAWRDSGEFPDDDNPVVVCDRGAWPSADADASRRLFAAMLYEDAGRYETAAKLYVAAARADVKAVETDELTQSYNSMCQDLYKTDALAMICSEVSDDAATRKLASAFNATASIFFRLCSCARRLCAPQAL